MTFLEYAYTTQDYKLMQQEEVIIHLSFNNL